MREAGAVIDTTPLVVYLTGGRRSLGPGAQRLMRRAESQAIRMGVPTICLFEIGQLEERGRVRLGVPFERWCDMIEESPAPIGGSTVVVCDRNTPIARLVVSKRRQREISGWRRLRQ
jgi:hypothetical protein